MAYNSGLTASIEKHRMARKEAETMDGVEYRSGRRRGHTVAWKYHKECDDGRTGGDGHVTYNGDKWECSTCGETWEHIEV